MNWIASVSDWIETDSHSVSTSGINAAMTIACSSTPPNTVAMPALMRPPRRLQPSHGMRMRKAFHGPPPRYCSIHTPMI